MSTRQMDSTSVKGLGCGSNFNDHVNLNMDFRPVIEACRVI